MGQGVGVTGGRGTVDAWRAGGYGLDGSWTTFNFTILGESIALALTFTLTLALSHRGKGDWTVQTSPPPLGITVMQESRLGPRQRCICSICDPPKADLRPIERPLRKYPFGNMLARPDMLSNPEFPTLDSRLGASSTGSGAGITGEKGVGGGG